MKLIKFQLETVKLATIEGNRNVDTRKLKKVIKKDGRVLVPILVMNREDINDEDVVLCDIRTGQQLENPSSDYYVILDGQHRSKCALELYDEMQEGGSNVKFNDFIYANVLEKEDIENETVQDEDTQDEDNQSKVINEKRIIALILSINSSTKTWASKDYIKSAYTHTPEDERLIVVVLLTTLGFSISNISRLLYNNHKLLTPSVLSRYINGEEELPEGTPRKALEIIRMLIEKGFDIKLLKKRYIAEEIVLKRNSERLDEFLNAIARLDTESINKIKTLTPQEWDNHKIREIVQDFDKQINEGERTKCFEADLSEKRFDENIDLLRNLAEELKKPKGKKEIAECKVADVK